MISEPPLKTKREGARAFKRAYDVVYASPNWPAEPVNPHWPHWPFVSAAGEDEVRFKSLLQRARYETWRIQPPTTGDAVVFMWSHPSSFERTLSILSLWGFGYMSQLTWIKEPSDRLYVLRNGQGGYLHRNFESLIVGTKTRRHRAEQQLLDLPDWIEAPAVDEGSKPAIFAEMIERTFPTAQKLSLQGAADSRPGWDAWET